MRARGDLSLAELDLATEAALLGLHTSFESFVRELYLQCVSGVAGIPGVRSNLRATSDEDAQAIVAGDRQFVDWLPISKTLDRALLHMRGGQPFVRIWGRNQVTRHLDLMQVVRNRIAHSGEEALRKYDKQIAKGQASFERPARSAAARISVEDESRTDRRCHDRGERRLSVERSDTEATRTRQCDGRPTIRARHLPVRLLQPSPARPGLGEPEAVPEVFLRGKVLHLRRCKAVSVNMAP